MYGNYQCFGESTRVYIGRVFSYPLFLLGIVKISPASMFRKRDWESIGGYDENRINMIEDWDFWYRLHHIKKSGHYINQMVVKYRRTSERYTVSRYTIATKHWLATGWYLTKKHRNIFILLLAFLIGLDGIKTCIGKYFTNAINLLVSKK